MAICKHCNGTGKIDTYFVVGRNNSDFCSAMKYFFVHSYKPYPIKALPRLEARELLKSVSHNNPGFDYRIIKNPWDN